MHVRPRQHRDTHIEERLEYFLDPETLQYVAKSPLKVRIVIIMELLVFISFHKGWLVLQGLEVKFWMGPEIHLKTHSKQ